MAFLDLSRFGQFLRNNTGLTPRVLSRRLREMQAEGLIERIATGDDVTYRLTKRGEDAVYILLAFLQYGIRHNGAPTAEASGLKRQQGPRLFHREP